MTKERDMCQQIYEAAKAYIEASDAAMRYLLGDNWKTLITHTDTWPVAEVLDIPVQRLEDLKKAIQEYSNV